MSEKIYQLFDRSVNQPPIGVGYSSAAFKIDDPQFKNYLLRVNRLNRTKNLVSENDSFSFVQNDYGESNFGQTLLKSDKVRRFTLILNAGTSIHSLFDENRKNYLEKDGNETLAAKKSYNDVLSRLEQVSGGEYETKIKEINTLIKDRRMTIDEVGINVAITNDNKLNFFDLIDDSWSFSNSFKYATRAFKTMLTEFDREKVKDKSSFRQLQKHVEDKVDTAAVKNVNEKVKLPESSIIQLEPIKLSASVEGLKEKLSYLENSCNFRLVY